MVFYAVLEGYQETKSVMGTSGAIDYSQAVLSPSTANQIAGYVQPSLMDYVADVELTAKKALSESDFAFFKKYFIDMDLADLPSSESFRERSKSVAENAGRRFLASGLYPMKAYLRPTVVEVYKEVVK